MSYDTSKTCSLHLASKNVIIVHVPISILPHLKIVSHDHDWLTEVHHSMLLCSRGNMSPLRYTFSDLS